MKNIKKAVFSVVEILFLLMFLSSAIYFIYEENSYNFSKDYSYSIISLLDIIQKDDEFRYIIINENLTQSSLGQNWTNLTNFLDEQILNYYLEISNSTFSKNIISCSPKYELQLNQVFILSENISNSFDFRILTLGVCI